MRGITLYQPFASAIFTPIRSNPVLMIKRDETRSKPYPKALKGQEVFIHAGLKVLGPNALDAVLEAEAFLQFEGPWRELLPFGKILGTVVLGEDRPTQEANPMYLTRMFGDYTAGRRAWELLNAKVLAEPIPAKGERGWWTYDVAA